MKQLSLLFIIFFLHNSKGLCQPFTVSFKPLQGHHWQYFHKSSYTGNREHVQFVSRSWGRFYGALLFSIDRHHSKYSFELGFIFDNVMRHAMHRSTAFNRDITNGTATSIGLTRHVLLIKKVYPKKTLYQISKNKYLLNGMPYLIGGASVDYLSNESVDFEIRTSVSLVFAKSKANI